MFQRFKRTVEWKKSKRKKKSSLTPECPDNSGAASGSTTPSLAPVNSKSQSISDSPADRPPSALAVINPPQGLGDVVISPSPTLVAPTDPTRPTRSPSAPPTENTSPSRLVSPDTTKSTPKKDHGSSKKIPASTSDKPTTIIRSTNAVLRVLAVLAGAPAVTRFAESLDKAETDCSTRKSLEEYCDDLLKIIKSALDKEPSSPPELQGLKSNLEQLHSELTIIREEIRDRYIPLDTEGVNRSITDKMQLFLFKSYLGGLITKPDVHDKMETRALNQTIRDLPRARAAYNDYTKDKRRVSCFEGTRRALLQEIAKWLSAWDDSRAYLLFGIAGIGKSTVAQTVAERADNLGCLGASFFFSRDEEDRRTAEKFFTTIAFHLCVYDEEFAQLIGRALTEERGAAATTKEPQEQVKALIIEPLRNVAKSRPWPIAIVVDALDECNTEDAPMILMALDQLVQELPIFKVIVTTRPQPHLQYLLDQLGEHKIFHLQNIENAIVDDDIRLYLTHCFSHGQVAKRVPGLRKRWDVSDQDIDILVQAARRLFIIASTTVLFVLDTTVRNPASRMKTLQDEFARSRSPFNSLNDFYTVILRSAVPPDSEPGIAERYQAVVGAIVLIEDPLPIGALANLINMQEDDVYAVLDNLQSVISLGADGVPLVYHKSFPDYVTDEKRCHDVNLRIIPTARHTQLAICCLRIMNTHLKRNILGLNDPARYFDNERALMEEQLSWDTVQRVIPPELQYASIHWAKHVSRADLKNSRLMTELKKFVEEHLLHWLEALSWIRKLDAVHISLGIASKIQALGSDMRQMFFDALRFTSTNDDEIQRSALHIYHSALPFAPTESFLYKRYKHELQFCQVKGGPAHWGTQINMKYHDRGPILSVAFANDSSRFASWDEDCVWLWDSASGIRIRPINGNRITLSDNFSVFAMPQDSSVTIFNASNSAPITSFNHPSKVINTEVSFDGLQLAVGLQDGTVRIWDVTKRVLVASLDDYDGRRLAFSPNGFTLVFTSKGGLNLWNGGDIAIEFEHEDEVVNFGFSCDGTRIATISRKNEACTLKFWKGEDGNFLAVVTGIGETLAVSADGSLVVTGGEHKELQIWRGDSLALAGTLPINQVRDLALSGDLLAIALSDPNASESVIVYDVQRLTFMAKLHIYDGASVAFSPDGTRLAAGNLRGAAYLWDILAIKASAPIAGPQYHNRASTLALTLDCSRLAVGRPDGSVELWDTDHMNQPIARHRLHSGWISSLSFVPDGNQLASGSGDKRVRFWNGKDGQPIGILEHSFLDELTSVAFSSSLLAAATENTITLWDQASFRLVHTFEQGSNSLSLSLDGSVLAFSRRHGSQSEVTLLNTDLLTVTATFAVREAITMLFPSPDGSILACLADKPGAAGFVFFDVANKEVISVPESKHLSWIPHLNGIPIALGEHDDIVGRFSDHHDRVPVLRIPRDCSPHEFTYQSSMVVLGTPDSRILLIKSCAT